ncbi:MAG: efflux RND transporter periplasmic adaptor subunit [Rickettsiales bacterium]
MTNQNLIIDVVVAKPIQQEIYDELYVTGKAIAELSQDITSKLEGKITSIIKHDKEEVEKGEIIIGINETLAETSLKNAKETLDNAKLFYEDQTKLANKNFASKDSVKKAKISYLNAKYNFEKIKKDYDNMIIKAPFDGEISSLALVEGNDIKPGDFLFTITSGNKKTIILNIPERFIFLINKDTKVFIENLYKKFIQGIILSTTNSINKSGHGIIKVELNDKDILHGSFVQAKLFINPRNAITIPARAIMRSKEGAHIYIVSNNNTAKKILVTISEQKHDIVEILSNNIKVDDLIIVEGLTKIRDNVNINIISNISK